MWVPSQEAGATDTGTVALFFVDRGGFMGMSPHVGGDLARAGPELWVTVCELGPDPLQGH